MRYSSTIRAIFDVCYTAAFKEMKIYHLHKEQFLPINIDEAWKFFSSANNLSKITPPDMGFEVLTDLKEDTIYDGMEIKYKVRPLLNIPVIWVTKIQSVQAPYSFKDIQLKGPYSLWEHTHYFETVADGVNMKDDIRYAIPFGILGRMMHGLLIKNRLAHIFDFRKKTLEQMFRKQL